MPVETITWKDGTCRIIDQTLLPEKLKYLRLRTVEEMWEAIRILRVRGAPAIGIAAAYGVYLGIRKSTSATYQAFKKDFDKASAYLATSRPTAVNLFWALERMNLLVESNSVLPIRLLKKRILQEAHLMLAEDIQAGRSLGDAGSKLLGNNFCVLTHCNAGGLATSGYGTALAVIYRAVEKGKKISVFADETRPLLQGSRLSTWELARNNIPVTAICDNMAGYVMSLGKIDAVIVGADRITASGDFANKIGTYSVAVLAKVHKIPFYVAAPISTFDIKLKDGKEIPIEERPAEEIMRIGKKQLLPQTGVDVFNPAFDVTPHRYVTAFITEAGIIKAPYYKKILKMCRK
jgi:methylthioribose-1-phosphate isomerase